jgi:uncharacterized membrane protein YvlD (DUF360 family)
MATYSTADSRRAAEVSDRSGRLRPGLVVAGVIAVILVNAAVIVALAELRDDLALDGPVAALVLALILSVVNGGALFAFLRLDLPITALGLGAALLGINIVAILVGGLLLPGDSEVAVIDALYMAIVGGATVGLLAWILRNDREQGSVNRS